MIDLSEYAYYEATRAEALPTIIKDIQNTCELVTKLSPQNVKHNRIVHAIHHTLKDYTQEPLWIFIGIKFIHWLSIHNGVSISVHLERTKLFHLTDQEISNIMVSVFNQRNRWLQCDIESLEKEMPHTKGDAFCVDCGKRWPVIYSILSSQKPEVCTCGNDESVLVSLKKNENDKHRQSSSR